MDSLKVTFQQCLSLEKESRKQSGSQLWFDLRKNRLTSSICHKVFIRKRNFENLCRELINPKGSDKLPANVKEALNHGKKYESKARDAYVDVLRMKLSHSVFVTKTGIVIQPSLYWLAASPDGLVIDETDKKTLLLEIKCPYTKRNMSPEDLALDSNFYVNLKDGKPVLKKAHSLGYYSQIQLAMGISGVNIRRNILIVLLIN